MTFKPRDKLILAPHNEQKRVKKVFGAKIQIVFEQHVVHHPKWKTHLLRIQNKLKIAKKNLYSNLLVGRTITSTIKREKMVLWFCTFAKCCIVKKMVGSMIISWLMVDALIGLMIIK